MHLFVLCFISYHMSENDCFCFASLVCPQWEARVTQYERDFDRIGMTVRKEVLRFEVCSCFCIV